MRLLQLQTLECKTSRLKIDQIGLAPPKSLPTLRGSIVDCKGEYLAYNKPKFILNIKYNLSRLVDDRFWEANSLIRSAAKKEPRKKSLEYWENHFSDEIAELNEIIENCLKLNNVDNDYIQERLDEINNRMWRMRKYCAWKRNFPNSESFSDFEELPAEKQLMLEGEVNDLAEMKNDWHELIELKDLQDKTMAQELFASNPNVSISARGVREYPYGNTASQVIGWITPKIFNREMFEQHKFMSYKDGEIAGFAGVEYACEPLLRGKRGEIFQVKRSLAPEVIPREFGQDIQLSLDIKLQKTIEEYLTNPAKNPNFNSPIGLVLIDVKTGKILAMVSTPTYDLNTMRRKGYTEAVENDKKPLQSRAIYKTYPPGSSIKPFILIIGLEENIITPETIISCPSTPQKNWPRCWLQRKWSCHDDQWYGEGGNNGVNALRGSCNIYFTKLAHKSPADKIQMWLWKFGFGREILQVPDFSDLIENNINPDNFSSRKLDESAGIISDKRPSKTPSCFNEITLLSDGEKKWFGMGQGNLRTTVLQVANAFAALARGGIFTTPILYSNLTEAEKIQVEDLNLKPSTIKCVRDGLYAVVNKSHGTAYDTFRNTDFASLGITVYGKTGSTQGPENAWFAGFAEDDQNRSVAIAVVVEGGQHGSTDASPIARDVFEMCNQFGYLGVSFQNDIENTDSTK